MTSAVLRLRQFVAPGRPGDLSQINQRGAKCGDILSVISHHSRLPAQAFPP
jgi:hypothetical protein